MSDLPYSPDFTLNDFIGHFPPTLLVTIGNHLAAIIDNETDMSEQYRRDLRHSWDLCYLQLVCHIGHSAARNELICPENI